MIKLAMIGIDRELNTRKLRTRMLLQVHDELVFDFYRPGQEEVVQLVENKARTALPIGVPIVIDIGTGRDWLEAHH